MTAMMVHLTALTDPAIGSTGRRLVWLAAGADGRPLGTAFLWVPDAGAVAELELRVHPAERRAGVGTRLLEAASGTATERGLGAIVSEAVRAGTEGDLFCQARSFRP